MKNTFVLAKNNTHLQAMPQQAPETQQIEGYKLRKIPVDFFLSS